MKDIVIVGLPGSESLFLSIELKKKLDPGDYYQPVRERTDLENKLKELLTYRVDEKLKELVSFQIRMLNYKDYILNGSERAIRNVKVKQKVSGQFKSWKAVENFLILI